ncbi:MULTISPECIES: ArsR/SmtB family transcription factor [Xenorhabdus]|uniref:ArsR family transcriptional regulator n=1 Tax=Xenorhabdus ehlersii TaxID=290111 RepID=A0A2D0IPA8_9GAMM|nr:MULTISPECIES: metalloregulator ArsR/SmtB family transcription factor [Xenorhabdus]MBC8950645.1 ArsR family transcriptional regulator [Xenorhabdus sp. TS4]PHM23644.1 ArsR family transcriptional regulator [Xenorhabdus ehlersii]RKE92752.1 ArsR family transcriptional regulator [Xenorhabdus ehlersii]
MFDKEILVEIAEIAKVLGNSHRLILLECLIDTEQSVENLSELSGLSIANTSQHLQHLKRAGLLQSRKSGKHVLYRRSEGPIIEVISAIQQYAEFNRKEMRRLIDDSSNQEAVSWEELLERIKAKSMTLLDVRPKEEFEQGHLPDAINIPVDELENRLDELASNRELIAYCRGPYCVLSANALALLRAKGIQARRFKKGFSGWKEAGMRIETKS